MQDYHWKLFNEIYAADRPKAAVDTFYHRWLRRFNRDRYAAVSSLMAGGDELLDLGCLDGDLVFKLEGGFKRFTGVDVVENRLETARQLAARQGIQAEFIVHDLNKGPLPFEDARFDAVTCVAVLEYIFDLEGFFREAARVLKAGGQFVFQVPNAGYLPRRLSFLAGRLPQNVFDPGMVHAFHKGRCDALARGAGLTVEKITGSGLFSGIRGLWPGLLTGDLIFQTRRQ